MELCIPCYRAGAKPPETYHEYKHPLGCRLSPRPYQLRIHRIQATCMTTRNDDVCGSTEWVGSLKIVCIIVQRSLGQWSTLRNTPVVNGQICLRPIFPWHTVAIDSVSESIATVRCAHREHATVPLTINTLTESREGNKEKSSQMPPLIRHVYICCIVYWFQTSNNLWSDFCSFWSLCTSQLLFSPQQYFKKCELQTVNEWCSGAEILTLTNQHNGYNR